MSPSPTLETNTPLPIIRLDESLVNRIAAGEIIHRPSSALKELIENSLDAGATQIKITVKDGGLKLLQIQDNGSGIRREDLPILCERFTTSKLATFSDLQRIQTYGFRGEALASISHVAHLSVVTKTRDETCAWKANYADGLLKEGDPKPCAGNTGTIITAEDLFYNTPVRLAALRSSSDEYARILDIVARYSVHNPRVAFTCKKAGTSSPDLSTPACPSISSIIKIVYGATVAKELTHITASAPMQTSDGTADANAISDMPTWKAEAYVTGPNHHAKKMTFLLFINNRSVESSRIKKTLEGIYAAILPKGTFPFIYLSLVIEPSQVDVNVHPTKREVHFMNEDEIVQAVANAVQEKLTEQSSSRSFDFHTPLLKRTQNLSELSSRDQERPHQQQQEDGSSFADGNLPVESDADVMRRPKKVLPQYKVRTSLSNRTLDSMLPAKELSEAVKGLTGTLTSQDAANLAVSKSSMKTEIPMSTCKLSSIRRIRQEIEENIHSEFLEIISGHIFVGIVDLERGLALLQHSTKLYLVNHCALIEQLFYQLGLRQFGNFHRLKLNPAPSLVSLIRLAVNAEGEKVRMSGLEPSQIVEKIVQILLDRQEMLREYFSLDINNDGEVESLPLLTRNYTPNLDRLPLFLMRLGPQVDWTNEVACFKSFLRELALFYTPISEKDQEDLRPRADDDRGPEKTQSQRWQIQHVLFPLMRKYLRPQKASLDEDVHQIAHLPDLYRVFERC
ncbi:DNA mismatch repair protein [Tulasnella sp. 419]|nr:DNA mismatch repair protein [Tulasnella sp. 419]